MGLRGSGKKGVPRGVLRSPGVKWEVEILQFYASMQLLRSSGMQLQGDAGQEGRWEAAIPQTLPEHWFSSQGESTLSCTPLIKGEEPQTVKP